MPKNPQRFPNFQAIYLQKALKTSQKPVDKTLVRKASSVKALIFDVDGVMTDGKIIYSGSGEEIKEFNVRDGIIISSLKKAGFIVGIISGRESSAVTRRATELKLDFCHQAMEDKAWACAQIMKHHHLKEKEIAYIGDDINDLSVFALVGFKACPADASSEVLKIADMVTRSKGGRGVVREVADFLLSINKKSK